MNKLDIIKLAKTTTYDEFMEQYCSYHLCPSIHGLEVAETRQECYSMDCDFCWAIALKGIRFKEESDEDLQNDLMDDLWEQELDTQKDLINSTK